MVQSYLMWKQLEGLSQASHCLANMRILYHFAFKVFQCSLWKRDTGFFKFKATYMQNAKRCKTEQGLPVDNLC